MEDTLGLQIFVKFYFISLLGDFALHLDSSVVRYCIKVHNRPVFHSAMQSFDHYPLSIVAAPPPVCSAISHAHL